ncbi:MAG: FAD-dependent oxidoreductase, partial [Desulfobacterales bacterium]|nr:FAD-dependent oxidoreductase [Desulfobacterales bacterium]
IEAVTPLNGGYRVSTASGASFEVDLVVHGAGRLPELAGLNLEAGGVACSARGIEVDAHLRTANPRVFAVGDCIASPQLARVADLEASVAAENILAERSHAQAATMDYRAVPSILFTYPQYGMVGQTEQSLKRQGIPYTRSFAHNLQWPTYTRIGLNHAAYKILVGADRGILGGHILADNASGLINTLKLAMVNGIAADSLHRQSILSPYPTRESDLAYMLEDFLPHGSVRK